MYYIKKFKNVYFASTGTSLPVFKEYREMPIIIKEFENNYPNMEGHVFDATINNRGNTLEFLKNLENPLAYCVFNSNVCNPIYDNLSFWEENNIPFLVTLYPGGGFILDDNNSDNIIKRIVSSPNLYKIICTQDLTVKYLKDKFNVPDNKIEMIFGIVTPKSILDSNLRNKIYMTDGIMNIIFVAHKYSELGKDKGYDIFIDVAKKIIEAGTKNVRFHVVGGFDDSTIDITDIKQYINFYGILNNEQLKDIFEFADIIVSPVRPFILGKGSFDGFPTGASTEAMSNGVVLITTDELKLNNNRFQPDEDIIIVKPSVNEVYKKIMYLYNNPSELKRIGLNGRKKVLRLYSYKRQLNTRRNIIRGFYKEKKNENK